jgi:hypothetical protein
MVPTFRSKPLPVQYAHLVSIRHLDIIGNMNLTTSFFCSCYLDISGNSAAPPALPVLQASRSSSIRALYPFVVYYLVQYCLGYFHPVAILRHGCMIFNSHVFESPPTLPLPPFINFGGALLPAFTAHHKVILFHILPSYDASFVTTKPLRVFHSLYPSSPLVLSEL